MAARQPQGKGEPGYVDPHVGIWNMGGVRTPSGTPVNGNGNSPLGTGHADRKPAGEPLTFFFGVVGNGDTWASGIPGVIALAVQVASFQRPFGAYFASAADARAGRVTFNVKSGFTQGWVHVWTR